MGYLKQHSNIVQLETRGHQFIKAAIKAVLRMGVLLFEKGDGVMEGLKISYMNGKEIQARKEENQKRN